MMHYFIRYKLMATAQLIFSLCSHPGLSSLRSSFCFYDSTAVYYNLEKGALIMLVARKSHSISKFSRSFGGFFYRPFFVCTICMPLLNSDLSVYPGRIFSAWIREKILCISLIYYIICSAVKQYLNFQLRRLSFHGVFIRSRSKGE